MRATTGVLGVLLAGCAATGTGERGIGGTIHEIVYPPSTVAGELQLGVTYRIWIPEGAPRVRGVIVHQHGCGAGACKGGLTAADDLHWQALARKWDCALLGPSYHQEDSQNCRLWCDPRLGSEKTYLRALSEFATRSGRPELATAPWCLWGHSGGGTWASLMLNLHPERIVAVWLRSGTSFGSWEKEGLPSAGKAAAVWSVPVVGNPGIKERDDKRFSGAWTGALSHVKGTLAKGGPALFAPDPRSNHECADSRYLAIPYFDACLAMRLPAAAGGALRPVDRSGAWLAEPLGDVAVPAVAFTGKREEALWLPNEAVAKAWMEYVKTGATSDVTPPPSPRGLKVATKPDGSVELTWEAAADFESGLRGFVVQRNGQDYAQVPEKPVGKFGRPLFQSMSYHDTPEKPLPEMRFVDKAPVAGAEYRIVAVNGVGLRSKP
jgi:pimeloyl-ACP methyl ester carboxylesterase